MADSNTDPRDITTDHETIRDWVDNRGGTPAHRTGQIEDASSLYIVREDEEPADLESISWADFFETFEAEEMAFVYQDQDVGETDEWRYDLIDRKEVAERATLDRSEIEESLLEGEVVRSEITETKVIEKTVVETDQLESQVVDSETIERNPVDREVISRKIVDVSFEDGPTQLTPTFSSSTAEPMGSGTDDYETDRDSPVDKTDRDSPVDKTDKDSPVDEPNDKTIPDPPVNRRSGDRDEVNRTATSQEEMQRDATGQQPGHRRDADERGDLDADHEHNDPNAGHEHGDRDVTDDRSVTDKLTEDDPAEESVDGFAVGDMVGIDVHDTVRTTTEVFDRKTVESRVVDSDITEADTVESDAIDIEGIEETLLESDIIEGELVDSSDETASVRETVPSGAITSERDEGDVVRSQFVVRRLIETESTEHHHVMCDITDHTMGEILDSRSRIVERAIVDRDAGEEAMLREPEAGMRTSDEQLSAAEGSAASTETAGRTSTAADAEMAAGASGETGEAGAMDDPTISDDEIGKQVISGDKEVGIVSDVDTDSRTLYVDPEPSLTDKIKATLDWGDTDDDSYPVESDHIEEITEDEVRIREL